MRSRSLTALFLALGSCVLLFAGLDSRKPADEEPPRSIKADAPPPRVLPGLLADGFVQLPNQWRLHPAGKQIEVGNFPVNSAVHPSGQYLAVLHAGWQDHEVAIIDLNRARQRIVCRVAVDQTFYGLCFSPDGRRLYVSGGEYETVHEFEFSRGLLSNERKFSLAGLNEKLVVGGLATDAAGREVFACCTWGDVVVRIPAENPENRTVIHVGKTKPAAKDVKPKGEPPSPPDGRKDPKDGDPRKKDPKKESPDEPGVHPYTCIPHPDGKHLFVSLWADAHIAVIDLEKNEVVKRLPCASHPTEMVVDPKSQALYVACANSTQVSVFELDDFDATQTINCALYPAAPSGNTPNSLAVLPDGVLVVANADASNLSVFNISNAKKAMPLGFIPTGWYPTSVRFNPADKKIYVCNGKGLSSKSNRNGPNPNQPSRNLGEYIGAIIKGTVSVIDLPKPETLANYTKQAYACSPLRKDASALSDGIEEDNPIPRKLGDKSPIKHVIYVIKENRTYDQVFGDLPQGNGEKELCLFPAAITPNHHKLASEFVLLDNTYVDGEVSADGHEWSMGAYATDFIEKYWPVSYRGNTKRFSYPSEGNFDYAARPAGGYIWDRCAEAGVSYRSYGEWIANGKKKADGTYEDGKASVKALEGHFDPRFRGFDMDYPDVKRAERFIEELNRFENEGGFPQLTILKLPNDHTVGTRVGKPTPTACVADNDLALGMVVEAVSKSKFWKETAIFSIEDDAQNGPDHVDAHRSVALVISPYTKRKYVDSTMYSTTSLLRTMELILNLKPMSQFDAAATPMYRSFTAKADLTAYVHEVPKTDLKAVNVAAAWGADWSQRANLDKEDQADDLLFNEVIWKAVKGASSRMPPPVRAAFFRPIVKKDDPDDDDDDD
jgi:DNA-binding beta-propeller fold protein YncE